MEILCPSASVAEGSLLFGMLDRRGQVIYRPSAIPVTRELLLRLPVAAEAEELFRFASPCARSACVHWAEGCALSARLSEFQAFPQGESQGLPECAIRQNCRWFLQDGPKMCKACQILARRPH